MAPHTIADWVRERVPTNWSAAPADVSVDREEILVVFPLALTVATEGRPSSDVEQSSDIEQRAACVARVKRFRDDTRDERMHLASEAEHLFERKVSWGASCGGRRFVFTHLAVPVMTRLRMSERQVLDTLLEAGVARSRSEALSWCVRLVERHQGEWIGQLRDALGQVEEVRSAGPDLE